jgi:hypothetical protein
MDGEAHVAIRSSLERHCFVVPVVRAGFKRGTYSAMPLVHWGDVSGPHICCDSHVTVMDDPCPPTLAEV